MKNLFVLLALVFLMSCDNREPENENATIPIAYWENTISIRVQNSKGVDLLNSDNIGSYEKSDISVPNSKYAQNAVRIHKSIEDDYFYLSLKLNYNAVDISKGKRYEDEVVTNVTFGNNPSDKVKALYEISYDETMDPTSFGNGYSVILQKAWFNEKLVYLTNSTSIETSVVIKPVNE